jgi:hypothetical protein
LNAKLQKVELSDEADSDLHDKDRKYTVVSMEPRTDNAAEIQKQGILGSA